MHPSQDSQVTDIAEDIKSPATIEEETNVVMLGPNYKNGLEAFQAYGSYKQANPYSPEGDNCTRKEVEQAEVIE